MSIDTSARPGGTGRGPDDEPTRRARLAFGLSGFADNAIGTCIGAHLFLFYTDVVGLSPLWVSAGLTIALLWNAMTDFAMGRISDRTTWRAGRRRPYVALGALPLGLAFALLMSPPRALSGDALGIYFTVALLLLFTAKTVVHVPTLALLPEMARGYDARTRLAASREQLGNVGDLAGLLLPIVLLMATGAAGDGAGDGLARDAFSIAAIVLGALAIAALFVTFLGTRERPADERPRPTQSSGGIVSVVRTNAAFRALLIASALAALSLAFVQSLVIYVLHHVMQEHDPAVQLGAFVVNAVAAILSYPMWTRLTARIGKPRAFRAGLLASSLVFVSVFFVGPGNYVALVLVMAFSGVANVGFWMLLHALNADVTDLDELEHGARREGLFAGFAALVRKVAIAGAAAGVGLGLTAIGYVEGVAPSASVITGLQLLFAVPTTLLVAAALFAFRTYAITPQRHAEIRAALDARAAPASLAARRSIAPRDEAREAA
ncbi:MAG: MFS transporter [Myxococcota bacterium]|nr:MFS transporter [Myxococcota bacterium]